MSKFAQEAVGVIEIGAGIVTGNELLIGAGALTLASALLTPSLKAAQAQATSLQLGEVSRSGVLGTGATAGSLVDGFNSGGKYGTDWITLVIALADHRCNALKGFYVNDQFVPFTGDGTVPDSDNYKFKGQLQVWWRQGNWDQDVPAWVLANAPAFPAGDPKAGQPTWTENDRLRGVSYVVVAYKADKSDAKHPVWSGREPSFLWVLEGALIYSARLDDTAGGAGPHRWDDPSTREFSDNLYDCRYTWVRGFYAGDKIDQPEMLLLGRGLSAVEAPPANVFAPANLCDEAVPLKGILSSLSAAVSKHDTSIPLSSAAGLASGMSIVIKQDGFQEVVTVSGVDGLTAHLSSGLAYDHPALTPVSWATSVDHPVTEPRYTVGGGFGGDDAYIDTENAFALACGGVIVERDGAVEIIPGAAQPIVAYITDDDLLVGQQVTSRDFRSITDQAWCNTVAPKYVEPTQQWKDHSAPVRVVTADVIADQGPRVDQPSMKLVTSGTQAQRVGEQRRRLGRLWRQRSNTLGPRFVGLEHGDWIIWYSQRYGIRGSAGGKLGVALESGAGNIALETQPIVLRVEQDGQNGAWQNALQFREISVDCFDWDPETDELADGAVATQPGKPDFGDAPADGTWSLAAITETGDGATVWALLFTGACDDDQAEAIIFEYAAGTAEPDGDDDAAWTVGTTSLKTSTTRAEVTGVMPGTTYWGAVSYRVAGAPGDRLVLGPVTTAPAPAPSDGRVASETGGRILGEDGSQIIKE